MPSGIRCADCEHHRRHCGWRMGWVECVHRVVGFSKRMRSNEAHGFAFAPRRCAFYKRLWWKFWRAK